MSSKVELQVHYSDFYRITSDSYGVNLSALERRQCSLDKSLERSFESIRKCLHRMFNVNPKTHLLMVVRIDRPRGGELGIFQISKTIKTTLTYAMLVRLNSPTG